MSATPGQANPVRAFVAQLWGSVFRHGLPTNDKVAATMGSTPRMSISRRAVLEMPASVAAGDPALDTISPGAEFEPVSPLDVPAFLRRQHEG